MTHRWRIDPVSALTEDDTAAVLALVERATDADGRRPISEHVWLHLRGGGHHGDLHLLARSDAGDLVGYAHMDATDPVGGPIAELAVDPSSRRGGLGHALIEELIRVGGGRLRLWAHGEQAGAGQLADQMGFRQARVLWQMRRSLHAPLPRPELPAGIAIRAFQVGVDDSAWLDLNARAFARLPDQGRWTRDDLDRRVREPWFDPAGFLLAWRGDRLVGFHWTKVHGHSAHQHGPVGEVYVVGVDPDDRGGGLGRALTLVGLHHLRSLDLDQAMLYVDASNTAAIGLYTSLGFARWDTDVLFGRDG
jgi:mycothiol synthase